MAAVGDILSGKYRLVRKLGEGGMGAVFEAEHTRIGKRVAVKLIHSSLAGSPKIAARFLGEARAAAATGHPAIVDVHDLEEADDGTPYLVMELLTGRSLADELKARRVLDVHRAALIGCHVLSALDAVHRAGILHRDIKPQNIFLARARKGLPEVKLLDFGVAKAAWERGRDMRLTPSGVAVGTPSYMAPEQARGERDLDGRADVWAVGIVLYLSLTGRKPFSGDGFGLLAAVIEGEIVPPRKARHDIPAGLEGVILRALAVDREDRFRSAAAMLSALLPYVEPSAVDRYLLPESDVDVPRSEEDTAPRTAPETPKARPSRVKRRRPIRPPLEVGKPQRAAGRGISGAWLLQRRWLIGAGALLFATTLGVTLLWLSRASRHADEPEVAQESSVLLPPRPRAVDANTERIVPSKVRLVVNVVPARAWVRVDGSPYRRAPWVGLFPPDREPHLVEVAAVGYVEQVRSVAFDSDLVLELVLQPEGSVDASAAAKSATGSQPRMETKRARAKGPFSQGFSL